MRRSDREVTQRKEILQIMEQCDVCRLAFNHDGYPYIVPLNFGVNVEGDKVVLYFHGATEGTKYELMKKDNRAGFEMDCGHRLVLDQEKGNCAMEYESVVGRGIVEIVPEEEKLSALRILMKQYREEKFAFDEKAVPVTKVYKLIIEEMSGKQYTKNCDKLRKYAFHAMEYAYAPYSNFKVGACVELKDGTYVTGANVENASYGLCNCAERSAVFAAYSKGYRKEDIKAMAVVTKAGKLTAPCGACRQVLSELLSEDTPILLSNGKEEMVTNMRELLPYSFGGDDLESNI